jgi:hypothetical protein
MTESVGNYENLNEFGTTILNAFPVVSFDSVDRQIWNMVYFKFACQHIFVICSLFIKMVFIYCILYPLCHTTDMSITLNIKKNGKSKIWSCKLDY